MNSSEPMNRATRRAMEAQQRATSVPAQRRPRIMIGVPCMDTVKSKFSISLAALSAFSARWCDLIIVGEEGSVIHANRNSLVRQALEHNADYLFQIDADMVFPPNTLMRLLERQKDMVCAFYTKRAPPYATVGYPVDLNADFSKGGLVEAKLAGFGLMLIKTSVFRALPPPWFWWSFDVAEAKPDNLYGESGEDTNFIKKARDGGFKLWADLDISFDPDVGHCGDQICRLSRPPAPQAIAS